MTDAVGDLVVIVKASRLTCEPSYMIVPNLARTCDGLAIGWRLVIVQLPVTDLLDRRFASRHHQVDHGLEPNGQNGVRFLNWHSVLGLILS